MARLVQHQAHVFPVLMAFSFLFSGICALQRFAPCLRLACAALKRKTTLTLGPERTLLQALGLRLCTATRFQRARGDERRQSGA